MYRYVAHLGFLYTQLSFKRWYLSHTQMEAVTNGAFTYDVKTDAILKKIDAVDKFCNAKQY